MPEFTGGAVAIYDYTILPRGKIFILKPELSQGKIFTIVTSIIKKSELVGKDLQRYTISNDMVYRNK